jgi:hypothetical protein
LIEIAPLVLDIAAHHMNNAAAAPTLAYRGPQVQEPAASHKYMAQSAKPDLPDCRCVLNHTVGCTKHATHATVGCTKHATSNLQTTQSTFAALSCA